MGNGVRLEPVIKKECDCKFSNVRWGWGSVIFNLNNWLVNDIQLFRYAIIHCLALFLCL